MKRGAIHRVAGPFQRSQRDHRAFLHDCRPHFGEGKASTKIRRPAKALRQNVEINMTKFHDGESEENGLTH